MERIAIYGASGHGKVIAEIAESLGYEIAFFIDDDENKSEFIGFPVQRFDKNIKIPIALGIGDNKTRAKVFNKIDELGVEILTLIHPKATISKRAILGKGGAVMANVVINSCATIGKGVILNTSCVVEHDNFIGDFVHISPNVALAGNVKIGEFSHIGIGSCAIQGKNIGKGCIVGAGAVVIEDIADNITVVGNPAKKIISK